MSKKNFTGGLNSLLGDQADKPKRGRPVTQTKEITKSSQEGTKENETRATIIINEELLDKLKAIAYWDRVLIKDVVNTALQEYVDKKKPKPRTEEARVKDQEANQRLIKNGYKARLPKF
jgi:predicted translin family RNA/ssDNA-binding protein